MMLFCYIRCSGCAPDPLLCSIYIICRKKWSGWSGCGPGEIAPPGPRKRTQYITNREVVRVVRVKCNLLYMRAHARVWLDCEVRIWFCLKTPRPPGPRL